MSLRGRQRLEDEKVYIKSEGRITVTEMSRHWDITPETARRDLDKLEEAGLVTRIHGGAIWNNRNPEENIRYHIRRRTNLDAKKKIAACCEKLLRQAGTIIADSSSTVVEALRRVSTDPNLLIVTNSTMIFDTIGNASCNMISTGGIFNSTSMSFQGDLAKHTIERYHAKLTLISCKGIDANQGIFDSYEEEAEIKKMMIRQGEKVALLADHTKFGRTAFLKLTDFDHIDYLITDECPSDEWVEMCEEKKIALMY